MSGYMIWGNAADPTTPPRWRTRRRWRWPWKLWRRGPTPPRLGLPNLPASLDCPPVNPLRIRMLSLCNTLLAMGPPANGQQGGGSVLWNTVPLVLLMVFLYFAMIAPQR